VIGIEIKLVLGETLQNETEWIKCTYSLNIIEIRTRIRIRRIARMSASIPNSTPIRIIIINHESTEKREKYQEREREKW